MLYADDSSVVLRSPSSLAKMMMVMVAERALFCLVIAEKKDGTMHIRAPRARAGTLEIEAAGPRYRQQTDTFV